MAYAVIQNDIGRVFGVGPSIECAVFEAAMNMCDHNGDKGTTETHVLEMIESPNYGEIELINSDTDVEKWGMYVSWGSW